MLGFVYFGGGVWVDDWCLRLGFGICGVLGLVCWVCGWWVVVGSNVFGYVVVLCEFFGGW